MRRIAARCLTTHTGITVFPIFWRSFMAGTGACVLIVALVGLSGFFGKAA